MASTSRFLFAVVYGLSTLIDIARSTDFDPSFFFPDDSSLSTTDNNYFGGGLSSDLFPGSNSIFDQADLDFGLGTDATLASLDPQWLNFDDSDPSVLEASCAGGGGTQTIGKVRREDGQICPQHPGKTNPDFSNLKFPTLMQMEQTLEGSDADPDAIAGSTSADDNRQCPNPYGQHVCCTGPGKQSFPDSGIWDFVQGCEPCQYPMNGKNPYIRVSRDMLREQLMIELI